MSRSASRIKDVKSSAQKELAFLKSRRSVSADTRARGSYIPDKKRPSSEERKSGNKLLRWSGTRKSSINLSDAKRKDARPLTDKMYQKSKISELVQFLNETGFSPPITAQKLMAPSKKDFENIFQFLYRFFDPVYEVKKIEEEGPKILKNLRYPFLINKSAFLYVARPNWPSLLGVLLWLMDLSKFAMKVDLKNLFETAGDDENAEMHKILVRYICQCHHAGTDNPEEEEAIFTQIIKSTVDLDKVIALNEEKKLLVASVEKEIDERKSLAEHIALLEKNIEKYEDYILKMKSHYESRSELLKKLMNELKLKESDLKSLQDEVSKKQDAYDAQGFDGKKHLIFFEKQKRDIMEKLEKKRSIVKDLQDKHWEAEIKYQNLLEKATAATENSKTLYNSTVESLKNALVPLLNTKIPQVQKLYDNFQQNFIVSDIPPGGCKVQSNVAFRDSWKSIVVRINDTDDILKRIYDSLHQKLTEIEMKKSEVSMKLKLLCLENNKQEQDLNSKKKVIDDEISALESQCEKLREIIQSQQDEKPQFEKTYKEMIEEKNILQEFCKNKEKELKEYLNKQEALFSYLSKREKECLLEIEAHGNEIAQELEELNYL